MITGVFLTYSFAKDFQIGQLDCFDSAKSDWSDSLGFQPTAAAAGHWIYNYAAPISAAHAQISTLLKSESLSKDFAYNQVRLRVTPQADQWKLDVTPRAGAPVSATKGLDKPLIYDVARTGTMTKSRKYRFSVVSSDQLPVHDDPAIKAGGTYVLLHLELG